MSCYSKCHVALPHGTVGWSAVCDFGISRSYSLLVDTGSSNAGLKIPVTFCCLFVPDSPFGNERTGNRCQVALLPYLFVGHEKNKSQPIHCTVRLRHIPPTVTRHQEDN